MSSPTVQNQRIQRAWKSPAKNPNKFKYLEDKLAIHVHIYTRRSKRFLLGYYNPDEITIEISELIGMKVGDAFKLMSSRIKKYKQMMKLLNNEE